MGGKIATRAGSTPLRPIAPYFRDTAEAAENCFDRETGVPIDRASLKSYADALLRYHLSPESKFENGDNFDIGTTRRRHVRAIGVRCIGKEANKWEEKSRLGVDDELTVEYGISPEAEAVIAEIIALAFGSERKLAEGAGISRTTLRKLGKGEKVRSTTLTKVVAGIGVQNAQLAEIAKLRELAMAEIAKIGLTEFAKRLNCDPSNLSKSIATRRRIGAQLKAKLGFYFSY